MTCILTYYRRNCSGWIHVVHPGESFPYLHCGSRRTRAHAPVLQSGFHHSRAHLPRSAEFDSCQHSRLFGPQRMSPEDWSARPGSPCFHLASALPKSLGNTKGQEEGRVEFSSLCSSLAEWTPLKRKPLPLSSVNSWPTFSCTTDTVHTNQLAVKCLSP